MVDVGKKNITRREAIARSLVYLPDEVQQAISGEEIQSKKGPVFQTAQIAGIMAVKKTADLIPLCHPLSLSKIDVAIDIQTPYVQIDCRVVCEGKTGVEMEALTGASIAALTIYDMCKAISHEIRIEKTELIEKSGGKSDYQKAY